MTTPLDIDTDVEWLYKGRNRSRFKKNEVSSLKDQPNESNIINNTSSKERSMSVSNASISRYTSQLVPNDSLKKQETEQNKVKHFRVRSSSLTQDYNMIRTPNKTINVNTNLSTVPTISEVKRSSSLNETPIKSIFGSLFNRRPSSSSPTSSSHPERLRLSVSNLIKIRSNTSSLESIPITPTSPKSGSHSSPISHFMKEPSSPNINELPFISNETSDVIMSKNLNELSSPIEELSNLSLKRVKFAVDKFEMDPPQQIPSRNPSKGNILVPDDMITDIPLISQGITSTQGSMNIAASNQYKKDSPEYKKVLDRYMKVLKESKKHQQEAHHAALRIANEVMNFKSKSPNSYASGNIDEEVVAKNIMHLEIDSPIHMHEHHFLDTSSQSVDDKVNDDTLYTKPTLEQIYTRCCHLREILPIPSTLKQIKNKTIPLKTLKFLNPKPTLVDILSFCDFISIVPVYNVVFDNVGLNPIMFKILVSSLVHSTFLRKLSIRNVVIDSSGWKLLCKFLLQNKSLTKLDISQTKIKPDLDVKLHRSNMDWSLFIDTLSNNCDRELEELLINGIHFTNLENFMNLLNAFAQTSGTNKRLGIAQSLLPHDHLHFLLNWMSHHKIQGVDLAFNDLSNSVRSLVSDLTSLSFQNLQYFTLNSTNIRSAYDIALLLRSLSKLPNLYYLDLSNLPAIFPDVLPYLNKYLPKFPNLRRLHLDNNELLFNCLSIITQILPKCKELVHVSLMHQPKDSFTKGTSASIYDFVKNSHKLTNLDINYDYIPEEISSRIALCLIRNTQKSMDENFEIDEMSFQDDLLFDSTLITETAENILSRLNNPEDLEGDTTKRYLLRKYWDKINQVHERVQKTIDKLFEKRDAKELSLQGKENLLRLLFVENTLSKILEILSNIPHIANLIGIELNNTSNEYEPLRPGLFPIESDKLLPTLALIDSDNSDTLLNDVDPHIMATDSGRTIDITTEKPVLRCSSQTSIVGKRQEQEEGEFHKWGFFVQQQRSIYPGHQIDKNNSSPQDKSKISLSSSIPPLCTNASNTPSSMKILKIPSGTELRDAIMKAKGISSIEELIHNVNNNRIDLDKIYGIPLSIQSMNVSHTNEKTSPPVTQRSSPNLDTTSIHHISASTIPPTRLDVMSSEDEDESVIVDETYDKVLNTLSRIRSNK